MPCYEPPHLSEAFPATAACGRHHPPVWPMPLSAATTRAFWPGVSLPSTVARRTAAQKSLPPSLSSSAPAAVYSTKQWNEALQRIVAWLSSPHCEMVIVPLPPCQLASFRTQQAAQTSRGHQRPPVQMRDVQWAAANPSASNRPPVMVALTSFAVPPAFPPVRTWAEIAQSNNSIHL